MQQHLKYSKVSCITMKEGRQENIFHRKLISQLIIGLVFVLGPHGLFVKFRNLQSHTALESIVQNCLINIFPLTDCHNNCWLHNITLTLHYPPHSPLSYQPNFHPLVTILHIRCCLTFPASTNHIHAIKWRAGNIKFRAKGGS